MRDFDNLQNPPHSGAVIVACDVGLRRIGVAVCLEGVVLPMAPILRKNRDQAASELSAFLKQKGADVLVVGVPKMDEFLGSETSESNGVDSEFGLDSVNRVDSESVGNGVADSKKGADSVRLLDSVNCADSEKDSESRADFERDLKGMDLKARADSENSHPSEPKTPMQRRIEDFVSRLNFGGRVEFVNEAYTSRIALENLQHMKRTARASAQKNGVLDSLSACEIMEIYLNAKNFA